MQEIKTHATEEAQAEQDAHVARLHGVLTPGSSFGSYVVGDCIGEGGMARIYRAEHAGLQRQVALKVLTNGFARDPEGRERFVREARLAAVIKHPNVVNIFDVGLQDDIPYMVMELLEGTDLETFLEARGAIDENLILDIIVPVLAGLTAVHDAGIVHRDLKPGNIFLAKGRYDDIEPKLLDFGISKANGPDPLKLTTRGLLMGTPFYMSPEALRGEEMTPLSDQYSLGVVMYECATGRAPFTASTYPDLFRVITSSQFAPPNEINPNLSRRLCRMIMRAMSPDPLQRYSDLREMGRELLQMAGQRTRITWALTFSDVKPAVASTTRPSLVSTHLLRKAPDRAAFNWRQAAMWLLVGSTCLMVGVLLARRTEDDSRGVTATRTEVHSAMIGPAASAPEQAPGNAVSDLTPIPPKKTTKEAKSLEITPDVVPVTATPKVDSVNRRTVQRVEARAAPTPRKPNSTAPEWALPSTASPVPQVQPKTAESRPALGPNSAPIFD